MKGNRIERLIRLSCIIALSALPLMLWSLVSPRPIPIIVAMSIGQVLGTLSLGLYVLAILLDLRAARVIGVKSLAPPPPSVPPSKN
jgi:hypothetical protein